MDLTKTGKFKRIAAGKSRRLSNPGMMLRRHTGVAERVRVRAREMKVPMGSMTGAAKAVAARLPIARIALVFALLALASIGILIGVNAYARSKQISIRLENGIAPRMYTTSARTVREFLEQNNIAPGSNDGVSPALNTRLTNGMTVSISRAMVIFVTSSGKTQPIYMTGGTVADALAHAGVKYDQDDEITPDAGKKLTSGMRIKHISVINDVITEYQYIKYSTVYQNSSQLAKGKTQLMQSGKQGVQTKQIKVVYKDGVEVSRTELSNMITQEPVSKVVLKGTAVKQPSTGSTGVTGGKTPGKDDKDDKEDKNDDDENKDDDDKGSDSKKDDSHYTHVTAEDLVVPPAPTTSESVIYMQITAYTHTGRRAAAGGWPQYTRTLAKPGTIAVDPKAIPYGTLLYVTGYGYCVAEDTGSNTVDSSRIGDVFMDTKSECYRWGRKRNVTVYIVQYNYKR